MKTKYFVLIFFTTAVVFSSCKKETALLNKYYGVWEVQKYEYYTQDIASGSYSLTTTKTLTDDTASTYFLLYNYMEGSEEKQNLCLYKFPTITSGLAIALGNSGACYWYMTTKDQVIMWDAGVPELSVTVTNRKSSEMEFNFTGGTFKEMYYLKREKV
jgi:hypothetical protein